VPALGLLRGRKSIVRDTGIAPAAIGQAASAKDGYVALGDWLVIIMSSIATYGLARPGIPLVTLTVVLNGSVPIRNSLILRESIARAVGPVILGSRILTSAANGNAAVGQARPTSIFTTVQVILTVLAGN
jgi:hypothetical protein